MLQAKRRGFLKHRFEITDDATDVTELAGFRRESCEFLINGERHRVTRERRKRLVFHGPRGWLATADQESGRHWTINTAQWRYDLVRPSAWRSAWELHQGSQPLGRFQAKGSTSTADLPSTLDLPIRLFAYYVVLINWERSNSAAAASAAGGSGGG
jgi:hypothetical protein